MTDRRLADLLEVMESRAPLPSITCPWAAWFTVVAQVQLALRHERNTGAAADLARGWCELVIQDFAAHSPEIAALLRQGFDQRYDVAR